VIEQSALQEEPGGESAVGGASGLIWSGQCERILGVLGMLGASAGTLLLLCWVVLACSLLLLLLLVLAWMLMVAGEGRVSWIWGRFPGKAKEREEKKSCDHDERQRHLLDRESLMLFP